MIQYPTLPIAIIYNIFDNLKNISDQMWVPTININDERLRMKVNDKSSNLTSIHDVCLFKIKNPIQLNMPCQIVIDADGEEHIKTIYGNKIIMPYKKDRILEYYEYPHLFFEKNSKNEMQIYNTVNYLITIKKMDYPSATYTYKIDAIHIEHISNHYTKYSYLRDAYKGEGSAYSYFPTIMGSDIYEFI
jgi:hypothetical protein